MNDLPEVLDVNTIARTRLFHIESVDLMFGNGQYAQFERFMGDGSGSVLVIPMPDPQHLLLLREYAVGCERYELGFVRGRIDTGESARDAALREMREEIGYTAHEIVELAAVGLTPAYSNYRTMIFLARGLYPDPLTGDEPEPLETMGWPLQQLDQLRSRDDFTDARSLLATYLVDDYVRAEK
ncbi:MAG: ADP compounds hydrolase NudE [Gammaproteobacteria bacterium]|nr:ADP compounds hydrolase NudE [Gammaproteobacteria bacterium]